MVEKITFDGVFKITDEIKSQFDEDGFIVVKDLLDQEEITQIWRVLNDPDGILKHSYEVLYARAKNDVNVTGLSCISRERRQHGRLKLISESVEKNLYAMRPRQNGKTHEPDGKKIKRILYSHPGNDVTGILSRSEKLVNACEKLLGGEVYHYHGKFILKDAQEGGRHVWHQDYGYWYKQNLFPDMITVWMPLDKVTKSNSCLQLLKGSHKCGRIDHGPGSGTLQTEADPERIEQLKKVCPHIYCEMEPGDVLFQHCNLLHTSDPNNSDMRRWAFVACYNRRSNSSIIEHHHPKFTPLCKVPDADIKSCRNYTDFSGKVFINPVGNEKDRKLYSQYNLRKMEQEQ